MSRPSPRLALPQLLALLHDQTDWLTVWTASLPSSFQKCGNNSFQSAPGRTNERTRERTRNPVFPTLRKIRVTGGAARRRRLRRLNIQIFSINLRIFEVEATFSFTFDRPSAAKISTVHHHPRNNNNFSPEVPPAPGPKEFSLFHILNILCILVY